MLVEKAEDRVFTNISGLALGLASHNPLHSAYSVSKATSMHICPRINAQALSAVAEAQGSGRLRILTTSTFYGR